MLKFAAGRWVAAVSALVLTSGCGESAADPAPAIEASAATPSLAGAETCASEATYATLRDMIFDKAVDMYSGDPVPLNSLRRGVSVRMEYPLVKGFNETLQRTDCSGRIALDLPPGVRGTFGGDTVLEADLEYSVQPAADGRGSVVTAEGIGYVVNRLTSAAELLAAQKLAAAGGPQMERTFNPSFDCGKKLSNVERMVCQDEGLAASDRALSDRYFELKGASTPAEWASIMASQRRFLQQRDRCADVDCVSSAYSAQLAGLNGREAGLDTFAGE